MILWRGSIVGDDDDDTAQHSTAQHSTAQHNTAQHSTAQHSTAQHNTAQHSTAQHSTAHHSTPAVIANRKLLSQTVDRLQRCARSTASVADDCAADTHTDVTCTPDGHTHTHTPQNLIEYKMKIDEKLFCLIFEFEYFFLKFFFGLFFFYKDFAGGNRDAGNCAAPPPSDSHIFDGNWRAR